MISIGIIFAIIIIILTAAMWYAWAKMIKFKEEAAWLEKYETIMCCNKLFITDHYNCLEDYSIISLDDYQKKNIIHLDRYYQNSGTNNAQTKLVGPAAVCKLKGEDKWEYLEL
jgi:uncharacterized membrane protein required for colicin V production